MRIAAVALFLVSLSLLVGQVVALLDLYPFEYRPLLALIGWRGLLLALLLNLALITVCVKAWRRLRGSAGKLEWPSKLLLALGALSALLLLDWMFLERPLTARMVLLGFPGLAQLDSRDTEGDFEQFSLRRSCVASDNCRPLRIMYERVRANAPDVFDRHPVASTIDTYSEKYGVDARFLFFRAYINSYYGEATSGPVPFLRSMTSETLRDIVQVHLPGWFVEGSTRRRLIESDLLPSIVGEELGFKLRYALHKATLDVSAQPFDVSTYSDIFLVMREFPAEFADVLGPDVSDPLRRALAESFQAIRDSAMVPPYEKSYSEASYSDEYYDRHRDALKTFARASYYLMVLDFDFATRVQALLAKYQEGYYRSRLGDAEWDNLPDWQQVALLAMTRDVFTPNVGRLAYNVYALPELHWPGVEYVADQAVADSESLGPSQATIWRMSNPDYLWAAPGYQLRILNEVWSLVSPEPIPGLPPADSVEAAEQKVWLADKWRWN